ncbi:hypothetical protein E2C01_025258 [Portunus trituberculatus]|uniref:Uncharacterized protein n=1 Tax=Portunus trituberculatus TaxID=210409 RepID=A0A5B7EF41_PORTR|nr:hypothetical protein [Portunus trituberculatus]
MEEEVPGELGGCLGSSMVTTQPTSSTESDVTLVPLPGIDGQVAGQSQRSATHAIFLIGGHTASGRGIFKILW